MVFTVTEVKQRRMLGILKDDRISSLKAYLSRLPAERIREVCIDMREGLWKALEAVFPQARVVVDPFHVVADANRRIDEARRLEQEATGNKTRIPKRVFLVGQEKLREEQGKRVFSLLRQYPNIKAFYWAKEELRGLYRQEDKATATKKLDNIILNLKAGDDGELIRWGNTLKRWREPILSHFDNGTTNGFTEGCNTKIKMLKRISYGLRNVEVYWRKMLLGFVPS
jgi:transposase